MKNAMKFMLAIALVLGIGPQAWAGFSVDQQPAEVPAMIADPGDTYLPGLAPEIDDGDMPGPPSLAVVPPPPGAVPYDTDAISFAVPNDPFAPAAGAPPGLLLSTDDGDLGPSVLPPDSAMELFYSPLPPTGVSFPTKALESFLGLGGDPLPMALDDDVDAYEDRMIPGPPGAFFSADWDAPAGLDPGDIYFSALTGVAPVLACDDVTQMMIAPNELTPVDVDAVHLVPNYVCAGMFPPGGPLCFLFSVDGINPPPPFGHDPGDIYITDCMNGNLPFLDDVTQLGIAPNEATFVDLDAISVPDVAPGVCEFDGDGFFDIACGGTDCDDLDPNVFPGALEICDGKDSDCDLVIPPNEADMDADQYVQCTPYVGGVPGILGGNDCDDNDANTYPGAPEICDAMDNDCDMVVPADEADGDSDQYVGCQPWVGTMGGIVAGNDCDDTDMNVNPGVVENTAGGNCTDTIDNDCDMLTDSADPGCGGGSCTGSAAASVQATPGTEEGSILNLLAFLLIPAALALGIVVVRRRR